MVEKDTGLCQGLYQWQTVEDAESYSRSVAMRFMAGRSEPGSVQFTIIDQSGERYWAFNRDQQAGNAEDTAKGPRREVDA